MTRRLSDSGCWISLPPESGPESESRIRSPESESQPLSAAVTPRRSVGIVPAASMHHELERAVRTIQRVVRSTVPSSVSGDEALSLVALLGEAERAVDSGIALFAPRVIDTGSFTKQGYATAPDWLGAVSGSPAAAAKGRLVAAERAAESPELAEAVRGGDLSAAQLKIVTDTAAVAPQAAATLLPLIKGGASHRELSAAASRQPRRCPICRVRSGPAGPSSRHPALPLASGRERWHPGGIPV